MFTPFDILRKAIEIHDRRVYEQRLAEADEKAFEILQDNLENRGDEIIDWLYARVPIVPNVSPCVFVEIEPGTSDGLALVSPYIDKYTGERQPTCNLYYPYGPLYENNHLVKEAMQSILDELLGDVIASFEYPAETSVQGNPAVIGEVLEYFQEVPSFSEAATYPASYRDDPSHGVRSITLVSAEDADYVLSINLSWGSFCESSTFGIHVNGGVEYNCYAEASINKMTGNDGLRNTVSDTYQIISNTLHVGMSDDELMTSIYNMLWI